MPAQRTVRRSGGGVLRLLSWILWLIPLSLLGGAGYLGYRQYEQVRARPEVTVGLAQRMTTGEAAKLFAADGYLRSQSQATVGPKIAGRVERVYVKEGMKVRKGDMLASIEHNDLSAELESRQAETAKTEAELEEARADLWEKARENARATRLFQQKSTTVEEAEKADAAFKKARARVAALEASVALMKGHVAETRAQIDAMSLVAPFDGTVVEKLGEEGEIIVPTASTNTQTRGAGVTIADLKRMDVETYVTEGLLSRLEIGQPAEVSVRAAPAKRYRGRVRQLIPIADRAQGTVKVKVEILDPDDKLFPELAAKVNFLPRTSGSPDPTEAYVYAPRSAIVNENGNEFVWVVGSGNRIRKRLIESAAGKEALAQVTSGLEPGEKLVLNPRGSFQDDELVRIAD